MEPPSGILCSLWSFILFLPFFIGLLILGIIKGTILFPVISVIITVGNSAIIIGLWPAHCFWTYYRILAAKHLGPVLKIVLCFWLFILLIVWLVLGIAGSFIGGVAYGFLSPVFATFTAVGEGKTNEFFHCIYDGTWSTVIGSFIVVRDFLDVCYHSYFSFMDDLKRPPEGKYYEIRVLKLLCSLIAGVLGFIVDFPVISLVALLKSFYMLFKGWHRLFHDCIGREGPFLETICVPFAGLAILLWPLAVVGAVLASMVSGIFLGAYAAVVVYQESSFWCGLCYIIASLSIYDEYVNDILDMPEGSCFPRLPQYRKEGELSRTDSRAASFSRPDSFRNPPSRSVSLITPLVEFKPLELIDRLFKECQRLGEIMVFEGLITQKDIEDAKSSKDSGRVISIGLPAYCFLQTLLRSAKANSTGLLLNDNVTEITSTNRPKDTFFEWFLNPLLIMKDQIKAENLTEAEEDYLGKLVLLSGVPDRLQNSNIGPPPETERKRAELDAFARRLQGITKSISRYPTYRRRFDCSIRAISEDLAKKNGGGNCSNEAQPKGGFVRMFSQKSFKGKANNHRSDQESQPVIDRDVDIV